MSVTSAVTGIAVAKPSVLNDISPISIVSSHLCYHISALTPLQMSRLGLPCRIVSRPAVWHSEDHRRLRSHYIRLARPPCRYRHLQHYQVSWGLQSVRPFTCRRLLVIFAGICRTTKESLRTATLSRVCPDRKFQLLVWCTACSNRLRGHVCQVSTHCTNSSIGQD